MAYNSIFPMNYQPIGGYYSQQPQVQTTANTMQQTQQQIPQVQQFPQIPTNNASPIWVQGEAGAKSYLLAPNNSVMLMDSEGAYFYMKSADASGMPSLKKYAYEEVGMGDFLQKRESDIDLSEYVKRDEIESIVSGLIAKKTADKKAKAEVHDK